MRQRTRSWREFWRACVTGFGCDALDGAGKRRLAPRPGGASRQFSANPRRRTRTNPRPLDGSGNADLGRLGADLHVAARRGVASAQAFPAAAVGLSTPCDLSRLKFGL